MASLRKVYDSFLVRCKMRQCEICGKQFSALFGNRCMECVQKNLVFARSNIWQYEIVSRRVNLKNADAKHFDFKVTAKFFSHFRCGIFIPMELLEKMGMEKPRDLQIRMPGGKTCDAKRFYGHEYHGNVVLEIDGQKAVFPAFTEDRLQEVAVGKDVIDWVAKGPVFARSSILFLSALCVASLLWTVVMFHFFWLSGEGISSLEIPDPGPPPRRSLGLFWWLTRHGGLYLLLAFALPLAGLCVFVWLLNASISESRSYSRAKRTWDIAIRKWKST